MWGQWEFPIFTKIVSLEIAKHSHSDESTFGILSNLSILFKFHDQISFCWAFFTGSWKSQKYALSDKSTPNLLSNVIWRSRRYHRNMNSCIATMGISKSMQRFRSIALLLHPERENLLNAPSVTCQYLFACIIWIPDQIRRHKSREKWH